MTTNEPIQKMWAQELISRLENSPTTTILREEPTNTPLIIRKERLKPGKFQAGLGIYKQEKERNVQILDLVGVAIAFQVKDISKPNIIVWDKKGEWITSRNTNPYLPWTVSHPPHYVQWETGQQKWVMKRKNIENLHESVREVMKKKIGSKFRIKQPSAVVIETPLQTPLDLLVSKKELSCGDQVFNAKGEEVLSLRNKPFWKRLLSLGPTWLTVKEADHTASEIPLPITISILIASFLNCTLTAFYSSY